MTSTTSRWHSTNELYPFSRRKNGFKLTTTSYKYDSRPFSFLVKSYKEASYYFIWVLRNRKKIKRNKNLISNDIMIKH